MGRITLDWYDADKSVLYLRYGKGWTHQDVFHAFLETYETVESVNHAVDLLVEITDQHIPSNVISMSSMLQNKISVNQRHTYFVGANAFIRILIRSAAVAVPAFQRVTFCNSIDEARKRLRRDREILAAHAAIASYRASTHEPD
jgi:hypothetical protein